jgi:hypothetical protein
MGRATLDMCKIRYNSMIYYDFLHSLCLVCATLYQIIFQCGTPYFVDFKH